MRKLIVEVVVVWVGVVVLGWLVLWPIVLGFFPPQESF